MQETAIRQSFPLPVNKIEIEVDPRLWYNNDRKYCKRELFLRRRIFK